MNKPFLRQFMHFLITLTFLSNTLFAPAFVVAQRNEEIPTASNEPTQPNTATVRVQPSTGTVALGNQFTVAVEVVTLTAPLSAFQFDLDYDNSLIHLVGVTPGPFLSSTSRGVICPDLAQPDGGVVRFACGSSGDEVGPTGDGLLATLTFAAVGVGNSPLTLADAQLPGPGVPPTPIPATLQSSQVAVIPVAGVTLGPDQQTVTGTPGTAVTHVFTVTNAGNYTDTFSLAVAGNAWPTTPATNAVGPLAAGQSAAVQVTVDIPLIAGRTIIASDTFSLTASSDWNQVISATVQATTEASVNPAAILSGDQTRSGLPGTTVTHIFTITNAGDYTDTFTLGVTGHTWPTTLAMNDVGPLAAGQSAPVQVTVDIPTPVRGVVLGSDTFTLTAVSGLDSNTSDDLQVTTTAIQTGYSLYLPTIMKPGATVAQQAAPLVPIPQPDRMAAPLGGDHPTVSMPLSPTSCYLTDLDCDQDVDEADLTLAADHWNCAGGDACYDALYDLDGNNVVDAFDLAWVGNDYDVTPPVVTITSPTPGQVLPGGLVLVTGTAADLHAIADVQVNGVTAVLTGSDFTTTVLLESGNQLLTAVAADEVGQTGLSSRVVSVDGDGPMIDIRQPRHRQSVYTLMPSIVISYTDFYGAADPATLNVTLTDENGSVTDVSSDLTATTTGAQGTISTPLLADTSYTLTVSLADTTGSVSGAQATFYVPPTPENITPPAEPELAGWVSGVIYDSAACDPYLTQCDGLAGATVTLAAVDTAALAQVRAMRARQFEASGPLRPMDTKAVLDFTTPVSGTIVTGPDGFFAFPVAESGVYWLRVEKDGYTYGQREAEIVKERSTATNAIYLTPLDTAVTPCDDSGCSHTSSDGTLELQIPPGAIPPGQVVDVNATNFEQVEYLPSGELPAGTWETYAFNLGGDSEVTFTQPITVRVANEIGFDPGTPVPLGYWNQVTQQWEHAGTGIVNASGQWIEMQVMHFSNYDCNDPIAPPGNSDPNPEDQSDDDDDKCEDGEGGCFISLRSGSLGEDVQLPGVNVLGEEVAPTLIYNTERANPTEVLDVKLSLNADPGVEYGNYVGFELYVEGIKTDSFAFSATLQTGEVGRYRYLWDGRDAQGNLMPAGLYEYAIKFSIPYRAEYCYALNGIFGNPPDCVYGGTGVFVDALDDVWVYGTVELDTQVDNSLGAGWVLGGQQRLYQDDAGRILIVDGSSTAEFLFPQRAEQLVLLVDDDDNFPDARAYYTETLDALGVAYDVWDTNNSDNEPDPITLSQYTTVIWFTGDESGGFAGPGIAGESALSSFLDEGKCLLISSQDYFADRGLTSFMSNYLGVASAYNSWSQTTVTGEGLAFLGLGPYALSYPFSNRSDVITPDSLTEVAFAGNAGDAGIYKDSGLYRTTYWGFPFEAIPIPADRQETMYSVLDWCANGVAVGSLAGFVTGAPTGQGIDGATITANDGIRTWITTTNASGFYSMTLRTGVYTVTAVAPNYLTATVSNVAVLTDTVTGQDFALDAGWLLAAPSTMSVTLELGLSVTLPLTLTNIGGIPASFELVELNKGMQPIHPFDQAIPQVDSRFQNEATTESFHLPDPPVAAPLAAGNVIDSWDPGLGNVWGLAYDAARDSVWVSSPGPSWGGNSTVYEFTTDGAQTGVTHPYTWSPHYGPADFAYNWHTGMLWAIDVGNDDCIHEIDPAAGVTGNVICPSFSISQRGLAYDPTTDTYLAGGWNDYMIYRFAPDGTIIEQVYVGLATSGLAYNPDTQHLFVMVNASPNLVYVLDAAADYNIIGQFAINQGFGAYAGAGLALNCDGHLWAIDQVYNLVYLFESGETTSVCDQFDVPWLSEAPTTGTVAALSDQVAAIAIDADQVAMPGEYHAQLKIEHDTPSSVPNIPVTMTVTCATCGVLNGAISDAFTAAPLTATMHITGPGNLDLKLTNDAYALTLRPGGYAFTVEAAGYLSQTVTITAVTNITTTTDFALLPEEAILEYSPSAIEAWLDVGDVTTNTVVVSNTGTIPLSFNVGVGNYNNPVLAAPATSCGADAFGYACLDSNEPSGPTYYFEDISGTGTPLSLWDDQVSGAIPLGFAFNYYGMDYNDIYVSSNGFLTVLPGQSYGCCSGQALPTPGNPDGVIAGWWENLDPSETGSAVYYQTMGSAPYRTFIVQFSSVHHSPSGTPVTFQFKLFESSNNIEVHYQDAPSDGGYHTAGIEDEAGAIGLQYFAGYTSLGAPLAVCYRYPGQTACGSGVTPWVSVTPISGTIPAGGLMTLDVAFDARSLFQIGDYTAELAFLGDFDNTPPAMPLTMHLDCPTCGFLDGAITDAWTGLPLTATIHVSGGYVDVTYTDAGYDLSAPAGTYTITVVADGYFDQTAVAAVTTGVTTTTDFALIPQVAILEYSPAAIEEWLEVGQVVSSTVTVTNSGTIPLTFTVRFGNYGLPVVLQPIHVTVPASDGDFSRDGAAPSTGPAPAPERKAGSFAASAPLSAGAPAYAIDWFTSEFGSFISDAPDVWSVVGTLAGSAYYAGDFASGDFSTLYVLDYNLNELHAIDTATGAVTVIGTAVPYNYESWTGMTGAPDGTMYASSTDIGRSTLYTVDLDTGAVTVVSEIVGAPCIIDIAINASSEMYGVDICSDVLVSINPVTAAATTIGSIGFNANYAQGMDFEEESNTLYLASYNLYDGELRIADTTTGNTAVVGLFPNGDEVDSLAFATGGANLVYAVPNGGVVPPGSIMTFEVVFDASALFMVGDYTADLTFSGNLDNTPPTMPLTMHLSCPTCGFLNGHISDGWTGSPLMADIHIAGSSGVDVTLTGEAYTLTVPAGPYTITVSASGYLSETANVSVSQGMTTTADFALLPITAVLAYTPALIEDAVTLGSQVTNTLTISNVGTIPFDFQLTDVEIGSPGQANYLLPATPLSAPILLVDDDDNSPDVRAYYSDTLAALGVPFDVWDTANSDNEPLTTTLRAYSTILWFTGDEFGGYAGPGPAAEAALSSWLDGGKCFFISGQDYYFDRGLTPFMSSYLGASSVSSDAGNYASVTGQGTVFGGLGPYSLVYPFTDYSDIVNPDGTAELGFIGDNSNNAAINKESGLYRTTFWGFPFESLATLAERQEAMAAILNWCGALDAEWVIVTPISGTLMPGQALDVDIVFDATSITQTGTYTAQLHFGGAFDNTVDPATLIMHTSATAALNDGRTDSSVVAPANKVTAKAAKQRPAVTEPAVDLVKLNQTNDEAQAADELAGAVYIPLSSGSTTIHSRTAADHTTLTYDRITGTYTRTYLDGTQIHFTAGGRHDYTLAPDGQKTTYTYNANGSMATMNIIPPGESTPRWTWTFSYAGGKLSAITDPADRVTSVAIDALGNLAAFTTPDGAAQLFAYDADHLMTHATDQNGAVTTHEYDGYGRLHRLTEPPRAIYDPLTGQTVITQEVRLFTPSDTGYALINDSIVGDPGSPAPPMPTSADLVDGVAYGRGGHTGHTNKWGNWLDESDGIGRTTTYERDDANNITRIDYPDGDCVFYTYDANGSRLSETRLGAAQCSGANPQSFDILRTSSAIRNPQSQSWTYTYEPLFNQIKTETDPLGNTTIYTYDYELGLGNAGKLARIEYPPVDDGSGQVVTPTLTYTYNNWGLLETETDARSAVTQYVYTQGTPDEAYGGANPLFAPGVTPVPGLLIQIIEDFGGENLTTIYTDFDGAGNPGTAVGPGGHNTTSYGYDGMNRVLTETNAISVTAVYAYDGRGNLVQQIVDYTPDGVSGRNVTSGFVYDADDQVVEERTADGGLLVQTTTLYDINGQPAVVQDGRGYATLYLYDDADQLAHVIDPAGQVMTYTYALDGQLVERTDADGYVTRYEYDGYGRLTSEIRDTATLSLTTGYAYDLNDNVTAVTDPAGVITCYEYDALNRRVVEMQDCGGLNLTTTTAYNLNGSPVSITDPRGVITFYEYDALNRATLVRLDDGGLNLEMSYAYDPAGNLAQVTDDRGIVTGYAYDNLNRMVASCDDTAGLNLCTTYTYDTLNNQQTITDPNSVVTFQDSNIFGQPRQIVEDVGGLNAVTSYSYDAALNLTQIVDANGNVTQYGYTPRNELALEAYADGTTVGYAYDGRGNLSVRTNQDGDTISHTYDGAGRLLGKSFSTGGSQTYTYDDASRLLTAGQTMHGHTSLLTYTYNSLGDVATTSQELDSDSWAVGYVYDYVSGVYTVTYPSGVERVQLMDSLGRLDSVTDGGDGVIADYTYDDLNSFTTVAYANGITTRTDYDALYRTTRVSSAVADYRYGYDGVGNRTYMQRWHKAGQPADVYEYDGLYQLTQVWYGADATEPGSITTYDSLQWYDLDNLGNRLEVQNDGLSQTYQPNDGFQLTNSMNRYEQVDATPFVYDLRGNTLNDQTNTYTYDILNSQTTMAGPGGSAEYIYDALGRRIAKVVDGVTTHFVYNVEYQVLEERAGNGSLAARYTYGSSIDEPLTMERGGVISYYHRDALGSIAEVTDAAGVLVERYEYDVYGKPAFFDGAGASLPASAIGNPYLFTGRRYDPESNNYYYRVRIYTPEVGRFLQMDPAGPVDGPNLYTYVRNHPTLLVDPGGMFALNIGIDGEFIIAAGPTPIPGVGWIVKAFFKTEVFNCCNKTTGDTEIWGTVTLGLSAEIIAGGSFSGKEHAPNSRGSKYRDIITKRYTKGPKSGFERPKLTGSFGSLQKCPDRGCQGFAEGFIEGKAGLGVGGSFSVTFPIYPNLKKPEFNMKGELFIVGASISIGVKGGGKCSGKLNDVFNIF